MDEERFELLLHRYFDQLLDLDERRELESTLLASPRARELFWETARWNAFLRLWGETEWGRAEAENQSLPSSSIRARVRVKAPAAHHPRRRLWSLAAAAVVLIAGFVGYRLVFSNSGLQASKGIAVLTCISEAAWADDQKALQPGEALSAGWFRLDRGAVQIEFSRGARLVLEGPAELQLVSENEAFLRRGRLNAYVPKPARGFRIVTPEFALIDHGTEFGCAIGPEGGAEVHVFSGAVSVNPSDQNLGSRELKKNQALQISRQIARNVPADRAAFLAEDELARRNATREQARLASWRENSRRLREHSAALVYLDFERDNNELRTLPNRAINAPPNSDASVVGCDPVDGRWPGKGGLEFKRSDDRLRVSVPGQFASLTLLAWVRVDGLPYRQSSLLMTESFETGELHWYLYDNGSLGVGEYLGPSGQSHGWRRFHDLALQPQNFGTWLFLVTVIDTNTKEVTHYLNGQVIGRHNSAARVPLRLDTFEIGNWGVRYDDPRVQWRDPEIAERNFHGRMDEFAILSTPLSAEEIRRLYREGRPGETSFTTIAP